MQAQDLAHRLPNHCECTDIEDHQPARAMTLESMRVSAPAHSFSRDWKTTSFDNAREPSWIDMRGWLIGEGLFPSPENTEMRRRINTNERHVQIISNTPLDLPTCCCVLEFWQQLGLQASSLKFSTHDRTIDLCFSNLHNRPQRWTGIRNCTGETALRNGLGTILLQRGSLGERFTHPDTETSGQHRATRPSFLRTRSSAIVTRKITLPTIMPELEVSQNTRR